MRPTPVFDKPLLTEVLALGDYGASPGAAKRQRNKSWSLHRVFIINRESVGSIRAKENVHLSAFLALACYF